MPVMVIDTRRRHLRPLWAASLVLVPSLVLGPAPAHAAAGTKVAAVAVNLVSIKAEFDIRLDLSIKEFRESLVTLGVGPWTLWRRCAPTLDDAHRAITVLADGPSDVWPERLLLDGAQAGPLSSLPIWLCGITDSGGSVLYTTRSDLIAGGTAQALDVFRYDRASDQVTRVSPAGSGTAPNGSPRPPIRRRRSPCSQRCSCRLRRPVCRAAGHSR